MEATPPTSPRGKPIALALIALLLAFYAFWAGSAIGTISPTVDEPLHASGAWNIRFRSDYRPDREDPPLWLHWIGLFLSESDIRAEFTPKMWADSQFGVIPADSYSQALESTDACDVPRLVRKARVPMLIVSLALGVSLAAVGWRYGGPVGGVVATVAFALEPLMLGHGVLAKNDVAFALCFLGTVVGLFEVCRHGRKRWLALTLVSAAAAVNVKFSGPLLVIAFVPVVLALRALAPSTWQLARLQLRTRSQRLLAAGGLWLATLLVCWIAIWASYGFRFDPTPRGEHFNIDGLLKRTATIDLTARYLMKHPGADLDEVKIDPADAFDWRPSLFTRGMLFAHFHRLLPESMVAGMMFTYASTLDRPAFLCGRYSDVGFTLFFPAAWLFKTPVTLVAAELAALAFCARRWRTWGLLFLPAALYFASAMTGRLNIGLRHLSPAYPFLALALALFAAHLWRAWPRNLTASVLVAALVTLALEVVPHRLEYIQFFSAPFGGSRGGLALLSDSSLDWGQDLYRLTAWQQAHPNEKLYLCYFGIQDPHRAGLTYHNTNGSWAPGEGESPTPGSVLAVSATHLQGTYFSNALRKQMADLRSREPIEALGGTIYLYRAR